MEFRFHGDQSSCRHVHLHTIPSQICSTWTLIDQHYMEFQFHRCCCSQWHVESTNNYPPKLVLHGLQQSVATWNSNFMTIGWDVDISSLLTISLPNFAQLDINRPSLHRIPFSWPSLWQATCPHSLTLLSQTRSTWTLMVLRYTEFQFHDNQLTCWHLLTTNKSLPISFYMDIHRDSLHKISFSHTSLHMLTSPHHSQIPPNFIPHGHSYTNTTHNSIFIDVALLSDM